MERLVKASLKQRDFVKKRKTNDKGRGREREDVIPGPDRHATQKILHENISQDKNIQYAI